MPVQRPEVIGDGGGGPVRLPRLRLPGRTGAIVGMVLGVLAVLLIILMTCFTYVRPNEFGIKQVNIGLVTSRGLKEHIYQPGFAYKVPFFEQIHRFPRSVQVLELTNYGQQTQLTSHWADPAPIIQTLDGFRVDADISILYRIVDPYLVITNLGPGTNYLTQGVLARAQPAVKEALGELTTEDFYNSPLRVSKAEKARELLNRELSPKGLKVEHVLVRYFEYSDEIQKNIEEKKLQDQMYYKNESEKRAATEAALVLEIREKGEAAIKVTLEGGQAFRVRKEAERDLYVRKKTAEADLLVTLAEAKATEMRNLAMQAKGSEQAVAMKMAEVLRGLDVIFVPSGGETGVNPLDLTAMIALFGAPAKAAPGSVAEMNTSETERAAAANTAPLEQIFGSGAATAEVPE